MRTGGGGGGGGGGGVGGGGGGDLSDFGDRRCQMGRSELFRKLPICWDFHTRRSLGFTENWSGKKKRGNVVQRQRRGGKMA